MQMLRGPAFASLIVLAASTAGTSAWAQSSTPVFTSGNVVVLVEGCGVHGGTCTSVPNGSGTGTLSISAGGYGGNQAAPVTPFQFTPTIGANGPTSASYVNSLVLPQTGINANLPLAGEYGSSSEGTLQLSGGGQYLTFAEYGINAVTYNAASQTTYGASVNLRRWRSKSIAQDTRIIRIYSGMLKTGDTTLNPRTGRRSALVAC